VQTVGVSGWLYEIDLMRDVRCNTVEDVLCQKLFAFLCSCLHSPPSLWCSHSQAALARLNFWEKDVRVLEVGNEDEE
jgi:hypothetical protein